MNIRVTPIADLVEPVETWNPASQPKAEFPYVDLSAVDQAEKRILAASRVRGIDAPSRARQLVRTGDVLISTVRPNLNGVAPVTEEFDGATASTGFCVLRPSTEKLDPKYLMHWVRSPTFVDGMVREATGASYPAVSDKIVKASRIPLPSIAEQRRVAAILDKADALRRKRTRALKLLSDLTQSVFLDMFGDPLVNACGFEIASLEDIVCPERKITYGIVKPGPNVSDGVPYVRVVDISNSLIDVSNLKKSSQKVALEYKRSTLKPGDLLFSIRGHVGRMAITPIECAGANITQDTARLAISGAETEYVKALLETKSARSWMKQRTKGAAVQGLNLGDLKKLPVILPPREQQKEFGSLVVRVREAALYGARQKENLDLLFASLQHRAFLGHL